VAAQSHVQQATAKDASRSSKRNTGKRNWGEEDREQEAAVAEYAESQIPYSNQHVELASAHAERGDLGSAFGFKVNIESQKEIGQRIRRRYLQMKPDAVLPLETTGGGSSDEDAGHMSDVEASSSSRGSSGGGAGDLTRSFMLLDKVLAAACKIIDSTFSEQLQEMYLLDRGEGDFSLFFENARKLI
jgi:hypothetical protein